MFFVLAPFAQIKGPARISDRAFVIFFKYAKKDLS